MHILWIFFALLGLPVTIVAALLGVKFGDGSGNESGIAEFAAFSAAAGAIFLAILIVTVTVVWLFVGR